MTLQKPFQDTCDDGYGDASTMVVKTQMVVETHELSSEYWRKQDTLI